MSRKVHTPHDIYFQNMMELLAVAKSFFKTHLPPQVASALDWNSLNLADSVRRTPHRRPTYTDITYVCYTQEGRFPIYLHVEQERTIDARIVERMLYYNLGLVIKHRKQKESKLPITANFVLYNGSKG